jgi:hypothetical protein
VDDAEGDVLVLGDVAGAEDGVVVTVGVEVSVTAGAVRVTVGVVTTTDWVTVTVCAGDG